MILIYTNQKNFTFFDMFYWYNEILNWSSKIIKFWFQNFKNINNKKENNIY
jgi:hypothetical protein